jgi:hypothetical protein
MANIPGMMSFVVVVDQAEKIEETIMFWPGVWETEIGIVEWEGKKRDAVKCIVDASRFGLKRFIEELDAHSSNSIGVMFKERLAEIWWQKSGGEKGAVQIIAFLPFTRASEARQKRMREIHN